MLLSYFTRVKTLVTSPLRQCPNSLLSSGTIITNVIYIFALTNLWWTLTRLHSSPFVSSLWMQWSLIPSLYWLLYLLKEWRIVELFWQENAAQQVFREGGPCFFQEGDGSCTVLNTVASPENLFWIRRFFEEEDMIYDYHLIQPSLMDCLYVLHTVYNYLRYDLIQILRAKAGGDVCAVPEALATLSARLYFTRGRMCNKIDFRFTGID